MTFANGTHHIDMRQRISLLKRLQKKQRALEEKAGYSSDEEECASSVSSSLRGGTQQADDNEETARYRSGTRAQSLQSIRRLKKSFIKRVRARTFESKQDTEFLPRKKVVIVGDGQVGKTSLLIKYTTDIFPEEYVPTVFETRVYEIQVDDRKTELALWDTAGQEDYDGLRPISYSETNVVLLCFAIDQPDSFSNIKDKWLPEIQHFCANAPVVLVATKADLRSNTDTEKRLESKSEKMVTSEEAETLCNSLEGYKYIECSSKTGQNVEEVFLTVARTDTVVKRDTHVKKSKENRCSVM